MLKIAATHHRANVVLAVTYIEKQDNSWWTILVRNHPLTYGWRSDFSRPIRRAFDTVTVVPGYQFSGGRLTALAFDEKVVQHIDWQANYSEHDKAMAAAALERFREETSVAMSDFLAAIHQKATLTKLEPLEDETTASTAECWHLHLGVLDEQTLSVLHNTIAITHTVAVISCLPLAAITCYDNATQPKVYSIIPEGHGKHYFPNDRRGLQARLFSHGQWYFKNSLEQMGRPVILRADNVQRLLALSGITPNPYILGEALEINDCEILDRSNSQLETYRILHIPTQTDYWVNFISAESPLYKQLQDRALQRKSTLSDEITAFSRYYLLVAKLYTAHDLSVTPIKQLNVGNWSLIAQLNLAKKEVIYSQLTTRVLQQLLLGIGCDIAFNNAHLPNNVAANVGYLLTVHDGLKRHDLSQCLEVNLSRAMPGATTWQPLNEEDIAKLIPTALLNKLCELELTDWQKAINLLNRLSNEERKELIQRYGVGSEQDRLELATRLNARIANVAAILSSYSKNFVKLPSQRQQNVAIVVTFKEQVSGQSFVLLVRNNPLTRGWRSDFYRWYYRLLDLNAATDSYQFPGGGVEVEENFPAPWIESILTTKLEQKLARAALRELWEESGLKLDSLTLRQLGLDVSQFSFKKIDTVNYNDTEKKTASTLHYLALDLGTLNPTQKTALFNFQNTQLHYPVQKEIGRDTVMMSWIRLDTIQKAIIGQRTAYSVVPQDSLKKGGHVTIAKNCSGFEKGSLAYYGTTDYLLSALDLPVALNLQNAKRLELLSHDLGQMPYTWPEILPTQAFMIQGSESDGRHDYVIAWHVPTGQYYELTFPQAKGKLDSHLDAVVTELKLANKEQAFEYFYRSYYLTAKLYALFGVNVLTAHLVKRADNVLGVAFMLPGPFEKMKLSQVGIPDSLTDAIGCDIVLANYGAMAYGGKTNLVVFNQNKEQCFRRAFSGLMFRGRGALKNAKEWSETIDLKFLTEHPDHAEFRKVCSQLDARKWRRILTVLESVTPEQITATVCLHGYGTFDDRQALSQLINQRLSNTILAIKSHLKCAETIVTNTVTTYANLNLSLSAQLLNAAMTALEEWLKKVLSFRQQLQNALQLFNHNVKEANASDAMWLSQQIIPAFSEILFYWDNTFKNISQWQLPLAREASVYQRSINDLHQLLLDSRFARYFMKLISYLNDYQAAVEKCGGVDFKRLTVPADSDFLSTSLESNYHQLLIAPVNHILQAIFLFKEMYANTPETQELVISRIQLANSLKRLLFLNDQVNKIQSIADALARNSVLNPSAWEELMTAWLLQICHVLKISPYEVMSLQNIEPVTVDSRSTTLYCDMDNSGSANPIHNLGVFHTRVLRSESLIVEDLTDSNECKLCR